MRETVEAEKALKAGEHIGPYRIVRRLGEGGIGEVYLAFDESLARDVAIKRLRPELAAREALVARFRTEAQTLARLNHPNIATLYALVDEGDATYMVMEYVEGDTVASLLRQRGALELEPALRLAFQALAGIGYAHERSVIHRDIKGSNLMLDANGTLKVMDFGIARVLGDERHTHAGQLIGTPEFMAPEQIRGEDADERADLYALAILLFSLFTGRAPFQARSEYDLMKAQVEEQPPSVLDRCPELPGELDAVLRKALAKEARHRFQNAAEFRAALQPFANDSWSDGPLVWPERARSEAECALLGDADIDAADEYHCSKRPLPFFQVEENELLPQRLSPGAEFNHRLQYVMCPVAETQVVSGTLHTRILYKGKPILTESIARDLQPGRWVVDSFITLPTDAKPGVYALQSEFKSKDGNFNSSSTFLVED